MRFRQQHINLNIDSTGISQHVSTGPLISRLSELLQEKQEQEQGINYGEKLLRKELLERLEVLQERGVSLQGQPEAFCQVLEILSALSGGLSGDRPSVIAYGTPLADGFVHAPVELQELLESGLSRYQDMLSGPEEADFTNKILYHLILERFYGVSVPASDTAFRIHKDGYYRYYELKIDFSNVDVSYRGKLPRLSLAKDNDFRSFDELHATLRSLDLTRFHFEGFTIFRFINRDKKYYIKTLENLTRNVNDKQKELFIHEVNSIFRAIVPREDISYIFLPIFEISGFPIIENEFLSKSLLLSYYQKNGQRGDVSSVYSFLNNPSIWSYGIQEDYNIADDDFLEILIQKKVKSYLGIPLFNSKKQFVGFIELFSMQEPFSVNQALSLKPFISHFAQLSSDIVSYLKNQINQVILDNFTSIQPAMQWRFNEVAVSYLTRLRDGREPAQIENIEFNDVYPFYGSIDIQDSTRIRNASQKRILVQAVEKLMQVIEASSSCEACMDEPLGEMRDMLSQVSRWIKERNIEKNILAIRNFFIKKVPEFLGLVKSKTKDYAAIEPFLLELERQRQYILEKDNEPFESSLTMMTSMIKGQLDRLNEQIQKIYPSYFETFRTDGVEYDIYLGQSITPTLKFDKSMVSQVRNLQLLSMIDIVRQGREISPEMPIALRSTQLIFIHPQKISIAFRRDEKRFDVQGGYNIRYQIIKKRIDKVLLAGSKERLVQPDHIAIVYPGDFNIQAMQQDLEEIARGGLIEEDFQFFELEELQGISDLRAVRIKVK